MDNENVVERIKHCGQALIDNAENIAGQYKYTTEITINIDVEIQQKRPQINVYQTFIPEGCIDTSEDGELKKPIDEYIL